MGSNHIRALVAAAAIAVGAIAGPSALGDAAVAVVDGEALRAHQCGTDDLPETGLQGDVPKADQDSGRAELGYNCGVALVGHADLDAGGRATSNANMAWSGDCAYVAGSGAVFGRGTPSPGGGVAVVDVSDPVSPAHVATLQTPGAALTSETINAVDAPGRHLLVVGEYGNQSGGGKPMDVYDVSDCKAPVLLETFTWPDNIHNLTISRDGRYVFATQPLQVADLDPLFDGDPATGVRYVGNLESALEGPVLGTGPVPDLDDAVPPARAESRYSSHEAWPTYDGTKLYLGGQLPVFEYFTIVDIEAWLADPAGATPEVLSQREGRGHSVRTATIGGTPYVLHSEESVFGAAKGCLSEELNPFAGPAEPWLTDISDETDPKMRVSQFHLEINQPTNCPAQLDSGVDSSVHYHDVDDAADTTFAMLSMWNAGLRIVDVRDPRAPTEVGYFNPGDVDPTSGVALDQAWAHVRYRPETGHIWLATAAGGFWVLELEPQVRSYLDLDGATASLHPAGAPARLGVVTAAGLGIDPTVAYCTLGPALSRS